MNANERRQVACCLDEVITCLWGDCAGCMQRCWVTMAGADAGKCTDLTVQNMVGNTEWWS